MAIEWYCRVRGQMTGPIAAQELKSLATSGQLTPESPVRQGTSGPWVKAGRIKGLFGPAAAAPANSERPLTGPAASSIASAPTASTPKRGLEENPFGALPSLSDELDDLSPLPLAPVSPRVPLTKIPQPTGAPPEPARSKLDEDWEDRRAASLPKREISEYRVLGVAVVAIAFGFSGVCFTQIVIIPIVLGLAGIIMTLRAVGMAMRGDGTAMGLSVIGAMLGTVACMWGLYTTLTTPSPLEALRTITGGAAGGGKSEVANAASGEWVDADVDQQVGNMTVAIKGAAVQEVPKITLRNRDGGTVSGGAGGPTVALLIKIQMKSNVSRMINYTSWNGTRGESQRPTLKDNHGSEYQFASMPANTVPEQLVGLNPLYPGDKNALVDMVLFQKPVDDFKYLDLTLPGAAFGEKGEVRFRIQKELVQAYQPRATSAVPPGPSGATPGLPEHPKGVIISGRDAERPAAPVQRPPTAAPTPDAKKPSPPDTQPPDGQPSKDAPQNKAPANAEEKEIRDELHNGGVTPPADSNPKNGGPIK